MQKVEYHILPLVKRIVGRGATLAQYTLWGCALLALAELVLLPLRMPLAGICCGMASGGLYALGLAFIVALMAWCHTVLLAEQGIGLTRWLVRVGAALAPLFPVCWGYTLVTGQLLLYRQNELPLILGGILVISSVLNIFRMAAAPWQLQARIVAVPVLLLLAFCCDVPGLLVVSAVCKLLCAWLSSSPLRTLADVAPRIISMPEKE